MPDPNWRLLVEKKKVSAQPTGAWTLILDSVAGYSRLKLEAEGNWTYSTSLKDHCGPDGDARSAFDVTHYLLPKAPPGCLIGKLGGSSAGLDDGYVFVVGSYCVVEPGSAERGTTNKIPDNGPLYLCINDRRDGMDDNNGEMTVNVFDGTKLGATKP